MRIKTNMKVRNRYGIVRNKDSSYTSTELERFRDLGINTNTHLFNVCMTIELYNFGDQTHILIFNVETGRPVLRVEIPDGAGTISITDDLIDSLLADGSNMFSEINRTIIQGNRTTDVVGHTYIEYSMEYMIQDTTARLFRMHYTSRHLSDTLDTSEDRSVLALFNEYTRRRSNATAPQSEQPIINHIIQHQVIIIQNEVTNGQAAHDEAYPCSRLSSR